MNPATIYTIMVSMVVAMTMLTAWTLDRLAAAQAREEVLKADLAALRRGLHKQVEWKA